MNINKIENEILDFWDNCKIFDKQLEQNSKCPPYIFYDGPPFATGLPHYGNLLTGAIKDSITRYKSQCGYYVQRQFGWDCHGLPVEHKVDKKLKITDHSQIQKIGIKAYNDECRKMIFKYSESWKKIVRRFARWVDMSTPYKTMDLNYMESVWWIFNQFFQKNLVYQSAKVMPISTACGTVLSNFEAGSNYKMTSDPSIIVSFPLRENENEEFLAWTTTPWTLPSNIALAVNPQFIYYFVSKGENQRTFIVGKPHYKEVAKQLKWDHNFKVIQEKEGTDLVGLEYLPLFTHYSNLAQKGCFKILDAKFVSENSGTGIVHIAPGFGEEDYFLCCEKKLIDPSNPPCPVDMNGKFTEPICEFLGENVKDCEKKIIKTVKEMNRLVFSGKITHSYPFCWRSETPLIYKAIKAWFIRVTELKDKLLINNQESKWVPKFVQEKRFHNWLNDARDWCFSRNRYWGNPIPLWVSDDGEEVVCIESIQELKNLTGVTDISDLHREYVDELLIDSKMGKGKLRRISEVFDCWFESGSMPYASCHYPFETCFEDVMKRFPSDFCCEGLDQTRGWFYTMNVVGTVLLNKSPFTNLIVHGLLLAEDGKKMSKSKKNYPNPLELAEKYGADPIRMYLISTPLLDAQNIKFSENGIKEITKELFIPWNNVLTFLLDYSKLYFAKTQKTFLDFKKDEIENPLDKWILILIKKLINEIHQQLKNYSVSNISNTLSHFLNNLTNWYLRLNRGRMKGFTEIEDWKICLELVSEVLLIISGLFASFAPMFTEYSFQTLKKIIAPIRYDGQESIHLISIHNYDNGEVDEQIVNTVSALQHAIELGRSIRKNQNIPIKFPLKSLSIISRDNYLLSNLKKFEQYLKEELNIFEVNYYNDEDHYVLYSSKPNYQMLGQRLKGNFELHLRHQLESLSSNQIQKLISEGEIQIDQTKIYEKEIFLSKTIKKEFKELPNLGSGVDKVVGVLLDLNLTPEFIEFGVARQFCSKIQKEKKKVGLQLDQQIQIYISFQDNSSYLAKIISNKLAYIQERIKIPVLEMKFCKESYTKLFMGNFAYNNENIVFTMVDVNSN